MVGYPLSILPLVVVEGGAVVDGGVPSWVVGGMVSEGRLCCWPPCLVCGVPLLCVGVPLVVYPMALLNGGVVCAVMPCLRIGSGALHCPTPSCIVQSPSFFCVFCYSIVGLGVRLCDRVMSLWNSGDGLCGAEWRWGEGVVLSFLPLPRWWCSG